MPPSLTVCPIRTNAGHTAPDCKGLGLMGSDVLNIGNFFEIGSVEWWGMKEGREVER